MIAALARQGTGIYRPDDEDTTLRRAAMTGLPDDDPTRRLAVAHADDPDLLHLAVVGDTYTVLLGGEQTAGRFALIDMLIPAGGGPPPHRHDFEECFRVLEGAIEVTLRSDAPVRLEAGGTVNIPANAPHSFRNATDAPARLLCTAAPAGLEAFFAEFGDRVASRDAPAPELSEAERRERLRIAMERAPAYGMEVLPPPGAGAGA
jgi:quercetin dioxygenase-like cupin family protein